MENISIKDQIINRISEEGTITELCLSEVAIDSLPDRLYNQPLEVIELDCVAFPNGLPQKLFQIPTLKRIELGAVSEHTSDYYDDEMHLTSIPECITDLPALESLELWDLSLTKLPNQLSKLNTLTKLGLSELFNIDFSTINFPPNLKVLELSNSAIETIPDHVFELSEVTDLRINHNRLTSLPVGISNLKNLVHLVLNYNPLEHFPEGLNKLTYLEYLKLTGCKIKQWPTNLSGLKSLKELYLNHNKIVTIGESISYLKKLRVLNLKGNEIIKVNKAIGELPNLEWLSFENNKVNTLPTEFQNLQALTYLNLNNNKFQDFPKPVYQLVNLINFHGNNNNFYQIFNGIANLKKLRYLSLHHSYLLFIAKEISELTELQTLIINYSPIKILPDLTQMQQLGYLSLCGLVELENPEEEMKQITRLSSLKELSLQNTRVYEFIPQLKGHKNLKRINLGFRELTEEAKTAIREEMKSIIIWIQGYR